jgi:hypothetical protein
VWAQHAPTGQQDTTGRPLACVWVTSKHAPTNQQDTTGRPLQQLTAKQTSSLGSQAFLDLCTWHSADNQPFLTPSFPDFPVRNGPSSNLIHSHWLYSCLMPQYCVTVFGVCCALKQRRSAAGRCCRGCTCPTICTIVFVKAQIGPNFGKCDPHMVLYDSTLGLHGGHILSFTKSVVCTQPQGC